MREQGERRLIFCPPRFLESKKKLRKPSKKSDISFLSFFFGLFQGRRLRVVWGLFFIFIFFSSPPSKIKTKHGCATRRQQHSDIFFRSGIRKAATRQFTTAQQKNGLQREHTLHLQSGIQYGRHFFLFRLQFFSTRHIYQHSSSAFFFFSTGAIGSGTCTYHSPLSGNLIILNFEFSTAERAISFFSYPLFLFRLPFFSFPWGHREEVKTLHHQHDPQGRSHSYFVSGFFFFPFSFSLSFDFFSTPSSRLGLRTGVHIAS